MANEYFKPLIDAAARMMSGAAEADRLTEVRDGFGEPPRVVTRVLVAAAARWQSFHVFDWQALARANPRWFGSDGVHPSAAGYRARATALARLVTIAPHGT